MKTTRVLVVEDDPTVLARLASLIDAAPDLSLVGTASTVNDGVSLLANARPDVLLTDLGLPDGSGVELIRQIADTGLDTEAMVVTVFGDESHVVEALEAGATGYLLKDLSASEIVSSIRQLLDGGSPISPAIARHLLKRFKQEENPPALPERLTNREHGLLKLIAKGYTAQEIADLEGITYYTVTTHIKNIYRKLAVNSRAEAIFEAISLKLIDP